MAASQVSTTFLPLTGAFASQANTAMEGLCLHSLHLVEIYLITSNHQFASGVDVGNLPFPVYISDSPDFHSKSLQLYV